MNKASVYETSKIMRRAANVTRFHTHRMMFTDKVGMHSFNSALLAYHIAHKFRQSGTVTSAVVSPTNCAMYMLMHDVAEHIVGDVPGHIKASRQDLKQAFDDLENTWMDDTLDDCLNINRSPDFSLIEVEKIICKFVDKFESLQVSFEELRLGNFSFKYVFNRINEALFISIQKIEDETLRIIIEEVYDEFCKDVREKFPTNIKPVRVDNYDKYTFYYS